VSLLTLTELREQAAAALAPQEPNEPVVVDATMDAIEPPALMLGWDEPWLTFQAPCFWYARLAVLCIAGRVSPDSGVADLEGLVSYVIGRLRQDSYTWPHETTRSPRLFEVGGIPLLAARVIYSCPVTVGGATNGNARAR
jgi:hypothetical protein